jgi:hypothetical protein
MISVLPRLNPGARAAVMNVGRERIPVLIVDDLLEDAEAVAHAACRLDYGPPGRPGYPGLNADIDRDFAAGLLTQVRPPLQSVFGVPAAAPLACSGYFGLVCTPEAELTPRQCVPHTDTTQPRSLAVLYYLCGPEFGGTGFFRHRATGIETLTSDRQAAYDAALVPELGGRPAAYLRAEDPACELTGQAEAKFNRMLVYPGNLLHSGLVAPERLSADPGRGRLTGNMFVTPG